jgi:hypothetical protein
MKDSAWIHWNFYQLAVNTWSEIPMKTIITGVTVAVLCAGLGFGAGGFYLGSPAQAASADKNHEIEGEHGDSKIAEAQYDSHGKLIEPESNEPKAVDIGRIMIPVYKAKTVSYVVATVAVSVKGSDAIAELEHVDGATKLRNEIITAMAELADTPLLRGETIDSHSVSQAVMDTLKQEFPAVEDLLFLSLVKSDVARG